MKNDKYLFMPSFSLDPSRVVSYNSVFIRDYENQKLNTFSEVNARVNKLFKGYQSASLVVRSSHNFEISNNAYRNLKRRINWLYYLSKSKSIKTYTGKNIYNFKMSFITLTLPSVQRHCTRYINSKLLNVFLTEIRQRTKMNNYLWRLEFQKNGNVHYHIATDTFIDYHLLLEVWNRVLGLHGYIDAYADKFKSLTLSEYCNKIDPTNKTEFSIKAKRYASQRAFNWRRPPSVNVQSVISNKAIANYIGKYFSKNSDSACSGNVLDNDTNSSNLRLWFCSRSLSKLNTISGFCEAVPYDIFAIVSYCKKVKKHIGKYATITFFEMVGMPQRYRLMLEKILKTYAYGTGYVPCPA